MIKGHTLCKTSFHKTSISNCKIGFYRKTGVGFSPLVVLLIIGRYSGGEIIAFRRMKIMYWVYITEDSEGKITIGFSAEMNKTLFELSARGESLSYLNSFSIPFDALAHKHLLDDLSQKTIRKFIRNHREETKRNLDKFFFQ